MAIRESVCPTLLAEGQTLLAASTADTPKLDAELLLAHALGIERTALLVDPPTACDSAIEYRYRELLARRANGEPVAYLVGQKAFYNETFIVNRSVLIPRPETEEMVSALLQRFHANERLSVCDIGAGSGCIALSLALERPAWRVTATDISTAALDTACLNARSLGAAHVAFVQSDLFDAVEERFDIVISNPPYVDEATIDALQPDVREYEPATALFADDAGLSLIRRLVAQVPAHLRDGGTFYCEIGYDQKERVERLFAPDVWRDLVFRRDLAGNWRWLSATLRAQTNGERDG